jgi:hypothetical protein
MIHNLLCWLRVRIIQSLTFISFLQMIAHNPTSVLCWGNTLTAFLPNLGPPYQTPCRGDGCSDIIFEDCDLYVRSLQKVARSIQGQHVWTHNKIHPRIKCRSVSKLGSYSLLKYAGKYIYTHNYYYSSRIRRFNAASTKVRQWALSWAKVRLFHPHNLTHFILPCKKWKRAYSICFPTKILHARHVAHILVIRRVHIFLILLISNLCNLCFALKQEVTFTSNTKPTNVVLTLAKLGRQKCIQNCSGENMLENVQMGENVRIILRCILG